MPLSGQAKIEYNRKWRLANPKKFKAQCRRHRIKHFSERLSYNRAWRHKNRIRCRKRNARYAADNKQKLREYQKVWQKKHREENLSARIKGALRCRIRETIKRNSKAARTEELLGCSIDQFLGHLELGFRAGITWNNYGTHWHIDHKKPCASFNLADPAQQRVCFNWKNLQPLLVQENLQKGARNDY